MFIETPGKNKNVMAEHAEKCHSVFPLIGCEYKVMWSAWNKTIKALQHDGVVLLITYRWEMKHKVNTDVTPDSWNYVHFEGLKWRILRDSNREPH